MIVWFLKIECAVTMLSCTVPSFEEMPRFFRTELPCQFRAMTVAQPQWRVSCVRQARV